MKICEGKKKQSETIFIIPTNLYRKKNTGNLYIAYKILSRYNLLSLEGGGRITDLLSGLNSDDWEDVTDQYCLKRIDDDCQDCH